ncbi:MAG: SusC/RagA family TonB-linked outer membrane protein [Cyclobacteriaceae bacterium]
MRYIIISLLISINSLGFSQSLVTNQVVDPSGEPIPGATIQVLGTQSGTISDANGEFSISLSEDQSLVITAVGFEYKEISYAAIQEGVIALSESISELDELVVTAFGLERQRRDLGYPVQALKPQQLNSGSANFVDELAGQLAGVTVSQGATGVGSTSKITIRGEASFTNNNPLFVVDGMPINNNSIVNFANDAASGIQEVDFGNGGMEINSTNIQSVSVLKGPGAAALYGARASNGVIIITTKDGSKAKGLGVSFNSSVLVDRAFRLPEFQNQYGQGNSGAFAFVNGAGAGTNDLLTYSWGPAFSDAPELTQFNSPVTLADGRVVRAADLGLYDGLSITPTPFRAYPNNLRDFYQTGITTENNLSFATGFDKGNFRFSMGDLKSESIIPGVNLNRKNVSTKLNFSPTERFSVNTSINYIISQSDNRPASGYGSENVNYSLVAWGPRSLNTQALKDYWQPGLEGIQQFSFNYSFFDNPYFILQENRNSFNRDRLYGNVMVKIELTPGLNISVRNGMDYSNESRAYRRNFSTNRFKNGGFAAQDVFYREINSDVLINYTKSFSKVSLDINLGANRMDQHFTNSQNQILSLAVPGIFNLSNGASPIETIQYSQRKRINSVYGLMKIGCREILFLELTGRTDWSSALSNPSFFYPSLSASYVISNAFDLPKQVSFAKLRASFAQVGNDTNPYQNASVFVPSTPVASLPAFTDATTIANRNLLPEQTTALEFGVDIRFFNERLTMDATYYNSLTENQIISLPISITSGYERQVVNGGKVRSEGIELVLGTVLIDNRNLRWNANFNYSRNVATVESLPESDGRLTLAYSSIYDNPNQAVYYQVEEGGQIGDMYGTGYLRNEEGEFVIDADGRFIVDNTLKKLGNYNPDFMLGMGHTFEYKGWRLNLLFDWRQSGVIVSRTQALAGVGGQLIETEYRPAEGIIADGVVNVGSDENPVYQRNAQAISAESYYRQYYDRNHEENNTLNASYFKLRSFRLTYQLDELAKRILNQDAGMNISLIGRNLFAISEIRHFDPEQIAVQGNNFISGVEDMSYATSRSIGLKIDLNF